MIALIFSPAARRDIASIWLYTADAWGIDQAESYVRALHNDMQRLCEFPELGSLHEGRVQNMRKLNSGHHLVMYSATEEAIAIIRILHERMDVPGRIG